MYFLMNTRPRFSLRVLEASVLFALLVFPSSMACGGAVSREDELLGASPAQDASPPPDALPEAAEEPEGCTRAKLSEGYSPSREQWRDGNGLLWECPLRTASVCAAPDGTPYCCKQARCADVRWTP
jgi:hypothetical protein